MEKNENPSKSDYVAPLLEVIIIEMEEGIASASATLRVGAPGFLDTPDVDDWISGGNIGNADADL